MLKIFIIIKNIWGYKIKFIDLGEPLRLILTGNSKGPSVYDIFYILGKTNTLKKINNFLI